MKAKRRGKCLLQRTKHLRNPKGTWQLILPQSKRDRYVIDNTTILSQYINCVKPDLTGIITEEHGAI